jgi:hypothetical protein
MDAPTVALRSRMCAGGTGSCGLRLQAKQARSAKRRLKKLAGRESRFARHVNHCINKQIVISKQIVRTAKGTGEESVGRS